MTERDLENLLTIISTMQQKIARLEAREINPVGTIIINTNPLVPANHLACDGASYSKTTYDSLYAVLGTRYGGDASNFNVPDLRGRVPLGPGNGFGIGEYGGEESHALSTTELPAHSHTVTDPGHTHPPAVGTNYYHSGIARANPGAGAGSFDFGAATANTGSSTTGITIGNTGSGAAHNNMPPYVVVSFIIVAR